MKGSKKNLTQQRQEVIALYRAEHGDTPASMAQIAKWALDRGLIGKSKVDIVKQVAHELAVSARQQEEVDPQGRTVRKLHCVRYYRGDGEQLTLWDDRTTANPEFMRLSLVQRRNGIVGDNRHLKDDTDSWNDNNQYGAFIPMSYNYESDMTESGQPTEYPEAPPEEDE